MCAVWVVRTLKAGTDFRVRCTSIRLTLKLDTTQPAAQQLFQRLVRFFQIRHADNDFIGPAGAGGTQCSTLAAGCPSVKYLWPSSDTPLNGGAYEINCHWGRPLQAWPWDNLNTTQVTTPCLRFTINLRILATH